MADPLILAFSTSSSAAVMPLSIDTAVKKLRVPESTASFGGLETVLKVLQALLDQIAPRQMIERHFVILRQAAAPNRL